jgi:hypothetical protein
VAYLLLPDDELPFVRYLTGEIGATMLVDGLAPGGKPHIALDAIGAWDRHLPGRDEEGTVLFWCSWAGPIQTLGDTPTPADVKRRVALTITKQHAGPVFDDLIDLTRTPILRWRRSIRQEPRRLLPAVLAAMELKARDTPAAVLAAHRRATSWLKRNGTKLSPFDHCTNLPMPAPTNLNPFWVWAHSGALSWLQAGGEVWPWTGG